jgi:DhnA family fructose-bisphosphate aldolase class Ia
VSSVARAVQLGADAVAVHVNVGSKYQGEMLQIAGEVVAEAAQFGMPVLGIMYPRAEGLNADDNYDSLKEQRPEEYARLVRHAVRIGVELGVDFLKTHYTGDRVSFAGVIDSALGVPVVISGGPLRNEEDTLTMAEDAISAGAAGISFGRTVFGREDPSAFLAQLSAVVHRKR